MKRKSSQPDFLSALQTSRPSADAAFVQTLKQKLLAQAEEILPEPRVSGLAFIFQSMKRYSLAYAGALVLVAFGTMMLLPRGLDPQEFLAKASEGYSTDGTIFYEKTLSQRLQNDLVQESSLEEIYYDNIGNYLRIIRNPDTEEIVQVDMTTWDSNNEGHTYLSPGESEGPVEIEDGSEADLWYKTYSGAKYYCVKMGENDLQTFEVFLKIAQSDPSVYNIDGSSEDKVLDPSESDPRAVLSQHDLPVETVKSYLNELKNSDAYSVDNETEDDIAYYVFEKDLEDDEQRHIAYYFNAETYALDKQVLTFGNDLNRKDLTTFLETKSISGSESASIFDPSKYDVVEGHWILSAGGPDYVTENGCYLDGTKLSDEETQKLLDSVPAEALSQWDEMFQEIMTPIAPAATDEDGAEEVNIIDLNETTLPTDVSFIKPTEGDITQGFHAGHYAYDIANRAKPDILAVASGTIVYASAGEFDGGYGTNVWIDHGNGYRTHYANMEEIYVKEGDTVIQGQVIGKMGNTGRVYGATGIHLHFELEYKDEKVSPSIMNVW